MSLASLKRFSERWRATEKPRDVIFRARGEDRDVVMRGQPLGHVPAMRFGAAGEISPVAMHDARQPHSRSFLEKSCTTEIME
jgi:hypothetical protein